MDCKEFINADEIAKGISPFQPESVSFEAGRIMIQRINDLLDKDQSFAFETTLSTKSFAKTVIKAQEKGFVVSLIFFWLDSVELAKQRVAMRVSDGGHNIPEEVIERRYHRGVINLFKIYLSICDNIMCFDNSDKTPHLIFQKNAFEPIEIVNKKVFNKIKNG